MRQRDFSDDQSAPEGHDPTRGPRGRSLRPPRRGGGLLLALVIVVLLAATYWTLRTPRETTPTPVTVVTPSEDAPATADEEGQGSPDEDSSTTDEDPPPAAAPSVQQTVARWATRESAKDESWSEDLSGQIAPDTARRLPSQTCLPVQTAPLRVDGITPEGEPSQSGTTWSGDLTLTITDKSNAQTPVTVRAQAMWDESTSTWVLTGLECLASGGRE